jgi:hypothetical protein
VVSHERQLGMTLAKLLHVGHVVAPEALEAMLGWGYRMLREPLETEAAHSSRASQKIA